MQSLIRLTDVTKSFGGVQALKGVSFHLEAGEVHALVGENGAGKSTLIRIITGASHPDAGAVEIIGHVVTRNDPRISRALGIACIYQQPALFPDLTVTENLSLRLESGGPWRLIRWAERRRRCRQLLSRVGASVSPDSLAGELTMPQQQLVEIAAAVGSGARVLILDEPTASIGEREVANLFRVIRELRAQGVGMIYISHRLEELPQVADRVTVLRDGARVATRPMAEVDRAELIRLMVGRPLEAVFPKVSVPLGDVVLETRNISCKTSGLSDVDLSVRAGEILGLAGLVGAGRTELARTLFGLTPASGGQILLRNSPVTIHNPTDAVRLGIACVPEDRRRHGVVPELPLSANASLAVLRNVARLGFIDRRAERRLASSFVERLSIKTPSVDAPVGNLSGGNQQKVALARWLAADPSVIILDEPTQGVDVGAKAEIHRLMGELAARGIATIMISSELPEVLGMSDRIAVMRAGTIAGLLDRTEATQEKVLELALGQTAATAEGELGRISTSTHRDHVPSTPDAEAGALARMTRRHGREIAVAAAYAALLLTLALSRPAFFERQFFDTLVSAAPVLLLACGMTLVILCRHIDISVGSQVSVCAVLAALAARERIPMPLVALLAIAAGSLFGAVNGWLVALCGLPSIVVTLATLVMIYEPLRWAREGEAVRGLPDDFQWFGFTQSQGEWLLIGIAATILLILALITRSIAAGRAVYAVGSDPEAAWLAGIRPRRVVFSVYVLTGALAGLAALMQAVRQPQVDVVAGLGLELQVIAAVVVGGAAITGGRGTLVGTLLGVLLLGAIRPALGFLGLQAEWERAVHGLIILLAVASEGLFRRRTR